MKERLQAADYRFIAVCLVLLAGATWYSAGNFYRAFPEASIDFRVNRGDAQQLAEQFLAHQGAAIAGYRDASSFTYDDDAKTFLEREVGLEKANQLMSTRVHLWRWTFRWFRPLQKEEFRVDITPSGEFVAFDHQLPEDAPRPETTPDQARTLAENFLRTRAHRDPASLDFVESSSVTRPKRIDRDFTWKERDFDVHDATYRVVVTVLGDEVGGYGQYLKIPENWTRDYQRLRAKNNEAQLFDTVALLGLMIGLIVVLVMRVRRQDVRWRRAAAIGVLGMVLSFLSSLNEFPLAEFGYPTTDAYSSFVMQKLLQAVLTALAWGGGLFVIAAGAEVLYRESLPDKISLGCLFSLRGLRTKRFFLGALLGVTLCAIFIAYQTIFYIVAYKYGAWSPADVPYSDLLNTKFPWAFVLFGGYMPAISEEFLFRMFAIPFLRKLVRWLPAAVVLAGFIWGFGHAGYPQQPFFIRGMEVGIGGVALGCIMLRWGVLPTLVWHYSVDAMYSAMLLMRSHSLYFKLSGAASAGIFVLPVVAALIAYWRQGGFEPDTGLLNRDESPPMEAPPEPPHETAPANSTYPRLSDRTRLVAIAIFVIGLLCALIPAYTGFGESPDYKLTADQARASADTFLDAQGIDPGSYLHVTYPEVHWGGNDSLAAKYLLEHGSLRTAAHLFERNRPVRIWATRYFKSLEKEEFLVTVQPETGQVLGYSHQIPEDRAGADLPPDAALEIATRFAPSLGLNVGAMELKESQSEKRKARRDYTLVWEARPGDPRNLAEAHFRVQIEVDGNQVTGVRSFWKVPESFERSRDRQNFISISVLALKMTATALTVVFGLWLFIRQIRLGLVPWRRALKLAVIPTLTTAIVLATSAQATIYRGYQTFLSLQTFMVTTGAALLMGVALSFVMYCAAVAFTFSFFPESANALRRAQRRAMAVDAIILLLLAIGIWHICHQVEAVLIDRLHALAILDINPPSWVGNPAPALAAIADTVGRIFSRAALLALLALLVHKLPKRRMLAPLTMIAAFVLVSEEVRTAGEFALEYFMALLVVGCGLAFCVWFARRNYLAYVLIFGLMALHPALAELLHSANSALQLQGWIVAGTLLVWIGWAVAPGLARR